MIPRRFRNWILFWTPMTWLILELVLYPKDVWWSAGVAAMLKGFFAASIGSYPPWVLIIAALVTIGLGVLGRVRKSKAAAFDFTLMAIGVVFAAWAFLAGGGTSGWAAGQSVISYSWAIQTVVVLLGGVAAWFWAAGNPERAELLVWNTHQVWRLYRGNWQGMVGLGILIVFLGLSLIHI